MAEAAKQSTVVFMENHGVITGARDVEEAEWFMENADAYCRMVLMAGLHKAPLNQVGPEGVADFLAIRKSIGYAVPGQPAPVQHGNLRRVQAGQIRQITPSPRGRRLMQASRPLFSQRPPPL